jgi:hypothetical protein
MNGLRPNRAVNCDGTRVPTYYVSKDYSVLPPVGQKVTYSSAGSLRSSPDYSPLIPLADAAFLLPLTELQGSDTVRRVCETVTGGHAGLRDT